MEFFNDVGSDPTRPSLFELVAQEQLRDLLQPALKYVLSVRGYSLMMVLSPPGLTSHQGLCSKISSVYSENSQQT